MTPGEIRRRTLSELRKARKDMMSAAWLKGVQELPEAERTAAAVAKLEVSLAVRQLENAGLAAIGQGLAENEAELGRGLRDLGRAAGRIHRIKTHLKAVTALLKTVGRVVELP